MNWQIFFVLFFVYELAKEVFIIKSFIHSSIELNSVNKIPNYAIKLWNMQINEKEHPRMLVVSSVTVIISGIAGYKLCQRFDDLYIFLIMLAVFLSSILIFIRAMLIYKFGTMCYLTPSGIVAIDRIYKKDCRFTVEEEVAGSMNNYKYINVYMGNNPCAFRFRILENDDKAIELIERFNAK